MSLSDHCLSSQICLTLSLFYSLSRGDQYKLSEALRRISTFSQTILMQCLSYVSVRDIAE